MTIMSSAPVTSRHHPPTPAAEVCEADLDGPRRPGLAYGVAMVGYPFAWIVGLAPVFHLVMTVPMGLWLLRRRPLRAPTGTITYVLFLAVIAASAVQVDTIGRLAIFTLRSSWYAAALVMFLYLVRQPGERAVVLVVRSLVALWVLVIVGGLVAVVSPELTWSTPVARALPDVIGNDEFVRQLITPRVAEIQHLRSTGVTFNRPAAPYPYTNAWGSTVAILTPFVLAAAHDRRVGLPKFVVAIALAVAAVPFTIALNRGAWLTLGGGVVYGTVRWAIVARTKTPIRVLAAILAIGLAVGAATGLSSNVSAALSEQLSARTADSNDRRGSIYTETIDAVAGSPVIGYGTTRPNPADPTGPPLGTHGQLWTVLFAHGYVAAGLYVWFFCSAFLRAKPVDPIGHWAKVALLIGVAQLPIYGHMPQQLFLLAGCAALLAHGSTTERSLGRP